MTFFYFWYLVLPIRQDIYLSVIDSPFCTREWNCINSCGKVGDIAKVGEKYKYSYTFFCNDKEYQCISFSTSSQIREGELVNIEIYKDNVELNRIVGMNIVDYWWTNMIFFCFILFLYFIGVIGSYYRMRKSILFGR
jgi:hypothetical protein